MELEDLRARAREALAALSAERNDGVDAFQGDALAFFARVPEPPLYRRRDDPTRALAAAMVEEGQVLLARSWRLGEAAPGFTRALELHLLALSLMAEGRVEPAEPAWHLALEAERQATAPLRLWSRTDEARPPVFDPETRRSRFDPRESARVEARLPCPACRKVHPFSLSPHLASHPLRCTHCGADFVAYVAELRALEVEPLGRHRRRYTFRLDEASGVPMLVEFEDATAGELAAQRRDRLAFLYHPAPVLRGVLNLDSSRVLWVSAPGACFVATVAFGEGAAELATLRAFRDRVLARSRPGRAFIGWYYREGPALARMVARRPAVRAATRAVLAALTRQLERFT